MTPRHVFSILTAVLLLLLAAGPAVAADRPNIVLVMTDDQGSGQTGYAGHPVLKTPHLDAMAANGLRFNRFYAGAPVCSPTRASVLTGRSNDRTGVLSHGYPLNPQERTLAAILQEAGYATGHFGKWHLNGLRGPGVPILAEDPRHPGAFGFETWLSVTNFFDRDPILSRNGAFEEFRGDSSEIVVDEALKFMRAEAAAERPFLCVIWYGSPHSPMVASEEDRLAFAALPEGHQNHLGELVAMDRSIGALRAGLRDIGVEEDTLLWFNSDNGGLKGYGPETVGGLRGWKGDIYEGGLRVPGIVEWPGRIRTPRIVAHYPACTMDILPTVVEAAGVSANVLPLPQDGISLVPLFTVDIRRRPRAIPFRHQGRGAWIDNGLKLFTGKLGSGKYELYDLERDPAETKNLFAADPEHARRMVAAFEAWSLSVDASQTGRDYPEGKVTPEPPAPIFWTEVEAYRPHFDAWRERPEDASRLKGKKK